MVTMIRRVRGYLKYREQCRNKDAHHLQSEGWALAKGVFSPGEVTELKKEINEVFKNTPSDERGPNPKAWDMFRYAMLNHSAACQKAVAKPGILKILEPLLGEDCHVIANTAWRNPPSSTGLHGGDAWHIDAGPHIPLGPEMEWPQDIPHPVFAVGIHIYLKACRLQDGPTGVIPGSHLSGRTPPAKQVFDEDLTYNDVGVQPIIAKPGDVGFFVSDIWHRRMPTRPGDRGRFFLQVHYGRRDIAQRLLTTDEVNHLSDEAILRARSKRAKTIAGLHGRLFYDG
jgi:hypothetical protein